MTANASMPGTNASQETSRQLNTPEFIDRLAENIRRTSGIDLPHAYFVEQAKRQLAGDPSYAGATEQQTETAEEKASARYKSSDCFKAWAIPE